MKRFLQKGFTLIELVTTVGIISIVVSALAVFVVDNYRFQAMTITEGASLGEAQRSIGKIKRIMRGATYGENGAFPIANAQDQTLIIYADSDFDGEVERVRFWLDDTILYKGVIEPQAAADVYPPGAENSEVLSANVANGTEPIFSYYDESYTGTQDPLVSPSEPSIKAVGIHLIVDTSADSTEGRYVIDTITHLRNL